MSLQLISDAPRFIHTCFIPTNLIEEVITFQIIIWLPQEPENYNGRITCHPRKTFHSVPARARCTATATTVKPRFKISPSCQVLSLSWRWARDQFEQQM